MLKILSGNIFNNKTQAIVNPVNCIGIMNKGLALSFKKAYPNMFKDYVKACKAQELYVGRLFIYEPNDDTFDYIINFPTKIKWQDPSKIEYIKTGLKVLVNKIKQLDIKSISISALGVGCGKLQWEDVLSLMVEELYEIYTTNIHVYLYKPLA